jgi:mRNA interferase HicA
MYEWIDLVHKNEHNVKARDLKKKLLALGWWKLREGASHEIWTNGNIEEPVPRHREINEILARKIIRTALTGKRK